MVDVAPQLQDHAVGLELEIVELARQADQAAHEGWPDREAELRQELQELYAELAAVAEQLTEEVAASNPAPEVAAPPAAAAARR
jgi:isopenicillin N synthase-like dioxygenase